jgi:hypothetical protein
MALFPGHGVVQPVAYLLSSKDLDSRCAVDSDGKRGEDKLGDLHAGMYKKRVYGV